jgi:LmbE family N-acetylglucosaminyl deacetylase
MNKLWLVLAASAALLPGVCAAAESGMHPKNPPPDDRYKADILLIVAHPDDETQIGGYLARAIFDEHKRVAVIFGTRGNGGGNSVSMAQAASLGAVREIEGRKALASFGVMNVWFLGGPDTPGQDVLRSLETWNHGDALWQAVRLVRLTRPEVILSWLPLYSAGENHGDHQAASVIATEAFDMAGDPTMFPEQVTPPRDRNGIGNLTEGLQPWQPKKIYYFSDASHFEFLDGKGPQYSNRDVSPARGLPYYKLAAQEMAFHLTQGDSGQMARTAIDKDDYKVFFMDPARFVFGKSLVGGDIAGDIFQGITPDPIPYAAPPGYHPLEAAGVSAEFGGPWAFYRRFWPAHGIERLSALLQPEVSAGTSSLLSLPVLIHNKSSEERVAKVSVNLPGEWTVKAGTGSYPAGANENVPVELYLGTPPTTGPEWQTVTVHVEVSGAPAIDLPLRVKMEPDVLPQ